MSGRVLVYGGSGALGSEVLRRFKSHGWDTVSVDFHASKVASDSVLISGSCSDDADKINEHLRSSNKPLDVVVCVAGGWVGGGIKEADVFKQVDKMWSYNVQSALAASHVASRQLVPGGLLVLTGANAALGPTPSMIAYGVTKAATHHLIKSLAVDGSGLPSGSSVVGVLPITLDTPSNRAAMPDADVSTWTPLDVVSAALFEWASSNQKRPSSGSLVTVKTTNGQTEFINN